MGTAEGNCAKEDQRRPQLGSRLEVRDVADDPPEAFALGGEQGSDPHVQILEGPDAGFRLAVLLPGGPQHSLTQVRNGPHAANQLGYALYCDMYANPARPANHARFIFFDDRARSFYLDWGRAADETVAILHTGAGRDPYDRALTDLVGELSTRSNEFRTRWATHNVRQHCSGVKHFNHPIVGELQLLFEAMELSADTGLSLYVYSPEPGTPSDDAIRLLASWAATNQQVAQTVSARATDRT